jgi:integrase
MRIRHRGFRTDQAYLNFHQRRHPRDLGAADVGQFLTHLAVTRKVSASTQSQGLPGLLFIYRNDARHHPALADTVTRANRPNRLPVVLTRAEVRSVLGSPRRPTWQ